MKEKIERAYNRLIRSLDSGIRLGGTSISESIEELERVLEDMIIQLEDDGFEVFKTSEV
ncbi:hypothetical protein PFJ87_11g00590 [Encephalitozoon hellem]|uniref:Uncharacterized protein n=1 Tax=Encephalitozoon hellem TaxID=27973 RepID=A0A9Q9C833_ENCHE|nr:hypothetical protein GPU96_11g21210 [Encephalitozoon hellem]WEL39822.1 hypothetical protein PFJ87_11g00590 [Encephalitozoon hellem]